MPTLNKSARFPPTQSLRFIPANKDLPSGYNTWPFDQGFFYEHIRTFYQQPTNYCQKVNLLDEIMIYFDCLATSVNIHILDPKSNIVTTLVTGLVYTHSAIGNLDSYYGNQYYTFIFPFTPADIPAMVAGYYYVLVEAVYAGDTDPTHDTMYVSECIHARSNWDKTMKLTYTNDTNDYDVFWEPSGTPTPWSFRCEMAMDIDPASHDISFENMFWMVEKLQSIPFRVGELMVGGEQGVPPWVLDKVNRILSLDTFTIDGVLWKKETNASWSFKKADNYPMKMGSIKLRDNPENSEWEFNNAGVDTFRFHEDAFDDSFD